MKRPPIAKSDARQEQVNRRLENGEQGRTQVARLSYHPRGYLVVTTPSGQLPPNFKFPELFRPYPTPLRHFGTLLSFNILTV